MAAFLIYIIKSTVYLGLFYAFFMLLMRRTTFFRLNRRMLLAGTLAGMVLPFYTLTVSEVEGIQLPIQALNGMLAQPDVQAVVPAIDSETSFAEPAASTAQAPALSLLHVLTALYLTGAVVYILMAIRSFRRMWKLIHAFPKQWVDGCWLVVVPRKVSSFSWCNYMVISEEDYENYPSVMVHERTHVACRHSWDLMFFTVVNALHWFNPMVWLARTELQQLHEFEADEGVIKQGIDATQYQLLLVRKAVGSKLYTMANSFSPTKLKQRITMMLQERTNGKERLKWLMAVPLAMGVMLLFASPQVKNHLLPEDVLDRYKVYFQRQMENASLTESNEVIVHSFNVDYDNAIHLDGKHIASADSIAPTLSGILNQADVQKAMHFFGVAYDVAADKDTLCNYLEEIKKAHAKLSHTPLVVLSPVGSQGKRYLGMELTFYDQNSRVLRNFTADELKDAVSHRPNKSSETDMVKVGFRATRKQTMKEVNEVRRMLKELYKPQEVIFRQSVWKK